MANSVSFLQMSLLHSEIVGNAGWCVFYFPQLLPCLRLSGYTQAIELLFLFLVLDFSKPFDKVCHEKLHKSLLVMVLEETFLNYFTPILQTSDNSYRLKLLGHL